MANHRAPRSSSKAGANASSEMLIRICERICGSSGGNGPPGR